MTPLSLEVLESANQIFKTSNGDLILLMNVAEGIKYNYHVLHFDTTLKLNYENHVSSSFIDSIINNTIYSTYHPIQGWATTEERDCGTDSIGQYKVMFNKYNYVGGNQYCKNIIDSILIDTSYNVTIHYRTRPREEYYDIDDVNQADSILTEKHNLVISINSLNFEYGTRLSLLHNNIDSSSNELFIKRECFIPKDKRIMSNFYRQLFELTKK